MATVILARHGRTTANVAGMLAGAAGRPARRTGVEQAGAAAERMSALPLAAVVTSPLERCRQTAAAIVRRPGRRPEGEQRAGADRVRVRRLDGPELKTLAKEPMWKTVQAHPSAAVFPGGESMTAMSSARSGRSGGGTRRVAAEHGRTRSGWRSATAT